MRTPRRFLAVLELLEVEVMPRRIRSERSDLVFHVMNRGAKRALLFTSDSDYRAMEALLFSAKEITGMRLLAYCIMPNHWHLILWPTSGQQMSQFMRWLTGTHAQRWQAFHDSIGTGAVYQGRYKAIPVQTEHHFLTVCR